MSPANLRCAVCNGFERDGIHFCRMPCRDKWGKPCDPGIHHSFEAQVMPLHKPVRQFTVCSCGWTGSPSRFEQHRRDAEPADIGRWIAGNAMSDIGR